MKGCTSLVDNIRSVEIDTPVAALTVGFSEWWFTDLFTGICIGAGICISRAAYDILKNFLDKRKK